MGTIQDWTKLYQYTEEQLDRIVMYRMRPDKALGRYLTYEEIAEREQMPAEDVEKVIHATAIMWNH